MSGIFGTFLPFWQLFWPFLTIFGPFLNWTVTVKEDDLIEVRKAGLEETQDNDFLI